MGRLTEKPVGLATLLCVHLSELTKVSTPNQDLEIMYA